MIVSNPCSPDARVLRAANTLSQAGDEVTIVAAAAAGLPEHEQRDGVEILRVKADPRLERALPALAGRARVALGRQAPTSGETAGVGTDTTEPARGLLGVQVWLAATEGEGRMLVLRNPRAALLRAALKLFQALRWLRFARSSWRVLARLPADAYVAHDLDTLLIGWRAKRRFGRPLVYDSHELYTEQFASPSPIWRLRWTFVERHLIRRADAVITVSDSIAGELHDRYGIARPTVVRNIPDLPSASGGGPGLRASLDIPEDRRIALYIGGIEHGRRFEHFVDTATLLHGDASIVLMGPSNPGYRRFLETYAQERGAGDRFRIAPPVPPDRVAATASEADLGLLVFQQGSLNFKYALPSKLFSSIHAGIPVVASAGYGEIVGIIDRYGVGVVCPSNDPRTLAAVIRDVLVDRQRYERMRANAHEAARELNWANESERLLGAFRRLAA
jgi:glycosyltransferase involved in cell wall biosynthesis